MRHKEILVLILLASLFPPIVKGVSINVYEFENI